MSSTLPLNGFLLISTHRDVSVCRHHHSHRCPPPLMRRRGPPHNPGAGRSTLVGPAFAAERFPTELHWRTAAGPRGVERAGPRTNVGPRTARAAPSGSGKKVKAGAVRYGSSVLFGFACHDRLGNQRRRRPPPRRYRAAATAAAALRRNNDCRDRRGRLGQCCAAPSSSCLRPTISPAFASPLVRS